MTHITKVFLFLAAFAFLLSVIPVADSYFPITHKYLHNEALSTYEGTSGFYSACNKHPDACFVGNILNDFTVAYYFVDGGEKYIVTHSPAFPRALLRNVGHDGRNIDIDRACAVGAATHQPHDWESHNVMIPYSILHTGLPNSWIHVFGEQHLDNYVVDQYPAIASDIDVLQADSWEKCIPIFKETLSGFSEFDDIVGSGEIDTAMDIFIENVQGTLLADNTGYDISFESKAGLFGKLSLIPVKILIGYLVLTSLFVFLTIMLIIRKNKYWLNYVTMPIFGLFAILLIVFFISSVFGSAFSTFVFIIKPLSSAVPIGNPQGHLDNALQNTFDLFNQGEQWLIDRDGVNLPDSSGFHTLEEADSNSKYTFIAILGLVILIFAVIVYFNFFWKKDDKEEFDSGDYNF